MTSIYQYTAEHNPSGTMDIIRKYGHRPYAAKDVKMNAQCLKELVQRHGESALNDIATVHPDFALITSNYQVPEVIDQKKKVIEVSANACGCSNYSNANGNNCACGGNYGNRNNNRYANADAGTAPGQPNLSQTHFLISKDTFLILGGVAIIGYILLKLNGK